MGLAEGFDLTRVRPIRALVHWPGFPASVQAAVLVVFVALIPIAWEVSAPPNVADKLLARSNLTTLLVWGVWWPAMVWVAGLLGRVWCAVCPLELASGLTERLGRWAGIRQRAVTPRWRAGWLAVALYALLQLLVVTAHLHRVPAYTAIFLAALLGSAVVVGWFFRDRAFCRAVCPVGELLSTYGRGGMVAVRPASRAVCEACATRDCLRAANRHRWNARSCPSLLNPPRLESNRDCLVCCQCIKVCPSHNMGLRLRWPFAGADAREALASWPTTVFVMLVSGFVTWELCTEWPHAETAFLAVPRYLVPRTAPGALRGAADWAWALVLVPVVAWSVPGLIAHVRGDGVAGTWRRLAQPLAVVVATGHMAKGLAKFIAWGGFLPHALRDLRGVDTASAFSTQALALPAPLLAKPAVAVVGAALVLAGVALAWREAHRATPASLWTPRLRLPPLALGVAYLVLLSGWT